MRKVSATQSFLNILTGTLQDNGFEIKIRDKQSNNSSFSIFKKNKKIRDFRTDLFELFRDDGKSYLDIPFITKDKKGYYASYAVPYNIKEYGGYDGPYKTKEELLICHTYIDILDFIKKLKSGS